MFTIDILNQIRAAVDSMNNTDKEKFTPKQILASILQCLIDLDTQLDESSVTKQVVNNLITKCFGAYATIIRNDGAGLSQADKVIAMSTFNKAKVFGMLESLVSDLKKITVEDRHIELWNKLAAALNTYHQYLMAHSGDGDDQLFFKMTATKRSDIAEFYQRGAMEICAKINAMHQPYFYTQDEDDNKTTITVKLPDEGEMEDVVAAVKESLEKKMSPGF